MKPLQLVGQRFGRLTVLRMLGKDRQNNYTWECRCDCGNTIVVRGGNLMNGHTRSCGCLAADMAQARSTTHGMSRSPEYNIWVHMIQRCHNLRNPAYPEYGGRGIRVCDRWRQSFENFLADVGARAGPQYSIDRIENDRGYAPDNVRWATREIQNANQRVRSDNTSGAKGVCRHKSTGKWSAYIGSGGKTKHLGLFDSSQQAAEARRQAEERRTAQQEVSHVSHVGQL